MGQGRLAGCAIRVRVRVRRGGSWLCADAGMRVLESHICMRRVTLESHICMHTVPRNTLAETCGRSKGWGQWGLRGCEAMRHEVWWVVKHEVNVKCVCVWWVVKHEVVHTHIHTYEA